MLKIDLHPAQRDNFRGAHPVSRAMGTIPAQHWVRVLVYSRKQPFFLFPQTINDFILTLRRSADVHNGIRGKAGVPFFDRNCEEVTE